MSSSRPNFSAFPFERLPRLSREHAAIESAIARHAAARRTGTRVAKLLGGPLRLTRTQLVQPSVDPHAALAEVRVGAVAIAVAASGGIRAITQRILGGVDELPGPRPATIAEHAILALVLAAALEDAGIAGEVWPLSEHARAIHERELADLARRTRLAIDQRGLIGRGGLVDPPSSIAGAIDHTNARPATVPSRPRAQSPAAGVPVAGEAGRGDAGRGDAGRGDAGRGEAGRDSPPVSRSALAEIVGIELAIDAAGIPLTVVCWVPGELVLRAPPPRVHPWSFELPIVVARCLLDRASVATLRVRDVVVVEPGLSLVVGDGAFGLTASPQDLEARVATGYVPAVTPADDAGLPVTVQLGTVRLSLRRLGELAVGEVIGLGRPLAGPYEIHAGGRVIGQGELVDLDGEIGIRIMSLTQE